jgi:site-specific DNA-methyltransferase (cytosine-N4-specific)
MIRQKPTYETELGQAYHGDSLELLKEIPSSSINLVVTSPPFALQRKKEYGNEDQELYVDWLLEFTKEVKRVLTDDTESESANLDQRNT